MLTILIVDDNLLDLNGVSEHIDWDHLGIKVVGVAADGSEGYQKAMELKPDIILTDVDMPILDGLKMANMIQKNVTNTKFVFMSCFDDFNYIKEAMDLDAFRYVLKPIKLDELTAVIIKIKRVIELELNKDRVQEKLQQQLQVSLPVLQEQFFRDLLYGKWSLESEANEQLISHGIENIHGQYSVAFIEIDSYELAYSHYSKEQKYAIIRKTIDYLAEILPQNVTPYLSNHGYHCIVIVLATNVNNSPDLMELLNSCKAELNEKMKFQVTIGISHSSDRLTHITELFYQAEYAVKNKFYGSGNCIIAASEMPVIDQILEYDLQAIKKELQLMMENGRPEDAMRFIESHYGKNKHFIESHVKSFTVSIVNTLQMILLEKNVNLEEVFGEKFILWDKLYQFETADQIKQWLQDLMKDVIKHSNNLENNRHKKVVEDIKKYIEENFNTVESVEQIAKTFYFSARYANHIFKQSTGKTIFDFLIASRVEAAQTLLLEPNAKVYDVSEKVGYLNNSYFCSLFKQNTGLTPKQYIDRYGRSS
ncbi:response regulator [Paenibacillus psychroresistens]|uniref:Response regulator n=1 Tax=Paenibacillus psychroresistens TaxID=1778678 RepID=A0A6B8RQD0_9BACL|nr:response regulator [Paenibacillus psychroresistens]QGQ97596.1 response regulator [Paenibacillus psychroresistens]